MSNGYAGRGLVLGTNLDNEAVRIDQLRRDHASWPLQVEDDPRDAGTHFGDANLPYAMIVDRDGLRTAMADAGRTHAGKIEVQTRGILNLIGFELIFAPGLDSNTSHVAK